VLLAVDPMDDVWDSVSWVATFFHVYQQFRDMQTDFIKRNPGGRCKMKRRMDIHPSSRKRQALCKEVSTDGTAPAAQRLHELESRERAVAHAESQLQQKLELVLKQEHELQQAKQAFSIRFQTMTRLFHQQQMQYESRGYMEGPGWVV